MKNTVYKSTELMPMFFLQGHTEWLSEVLQPKSFYDSVFIL